MGVRKTTAAAFAPYLLASVQAIVTPNGQGKLPTLGWNSWNAYHCSVDATKILSAANSLVSLGLADVGYTYVNIDDCWEEMSRNATTSQLVPNATAFPDGIAGVADHVHAMNLSLGIYNTAGSATCAGYPASLGYEDIDAATFASWGVDFLKYDNCNVPANWTDQYVYCTPDRVNVTANGTCNTDLDPDLAPPGYDWSTSNSATRFNRMRDALAKQDREIIYNLCIWGTADVYAWGNDTAISWRMSDDIQPDWSDITRIVNINSFKMNSVDFWGHNDADMLEVGNGNLTAAETRSHFALWAAMKSPLVIGTDLSQLSDENVGILKNEQLLAFNQDDVFGTPAVPFARGTNPDWSFNASWPAEYWAGQSQKGTLVLMLNPAETERNMTAEWKDVPGLAEGGYKVTDVWTGADLGCVKDCYEVAVESHDTAVVMVGEGC